MESTGHTQQSTLNQLQAILDRLDTERKAVITAIREISPDYGSREEPTIPSFIRDDDQPEDPDIDLSDISVDFTPARNQTEKLFILFEAAARRGKFLNIGKVAEYMMRHTDTTAKLRSMKTAVYHAIKDHIEHFQKIGGTTYKYTPERQGTEEEPEE